MDKYIYLGGIYHIMCDKKTINIIHGMRAFYKVLDNNGQNADRIMRHMIQFMEMEKKISLDDINY